MKEKYIKSFEGLRGYAFLLIFLSHCSIPIISENIGALGVTIFIMLSGYLCMNQYSMGGALDTMEIMKKKLIKCMPLHFVTLLCVLPIVLQQYTYFNKARILYLFLNMFCLQAWIPEQSVFFSFNYVSWFLSVYFFLMIMSVPIYQFLKEKIQIQLYIVIAFTICIQFGLAFLAEGVYAHWITYIFPISRILDFLLGGVLPFAKSKKNSTLVQVSAISF